MTGTKRELYHVSYMHEDDIWVKQGKSLVLCEEAQQQQQQHKHFVFDLDETIGSFRELHMLCHELLSKNQSLVDRLVELLRLFPEFLRPGIVPILQFLHQNKLQQRFGKFYVYTNNQCGRSWTESIVQAVEIVAETPQLVDHIICAFKIGSVVVESRRTSHWKTWRDLVRCTLLPPQAQICFIDDTYFPKMRRDRVFYLQPRPYQHRLSLSDIAQRLKKDYSTTTIVTTDRDEVALSKRLMYYIREFFHMALRRPHTQKLKSKFWYNLTQRKRK